MIEEITCWTYNVNYPGVLEVDCSGLSPNFSIKIGDIEKTLPHGVFLHKDWAARKFHTVCKLTETPIYVQRKNAVYEQIDQIKEEKQKLQKKLMDSQKKAKVMRDLRLNIPKHKQTSKSIMAEKKEMEKNMGK